MEVEDYYSYYARIIPCLSALYCFAYLGKLFFQPNCIGMEASLTYITSARGNIGNAHLTTFDKDLHLSEFEYHTSLTMFYLGYLIFQLPFSLLMKW
jgi:hypothetical protein